MAALTSGLLFTNDNSPGFTRRRCGRGFAYYDEARELIRQPDIRKRIDGLAIPPAYCDVWICSMPEGHLQATGIDGRERKQYRYHPDWRKIRNERKFEKLLDFAAKLPAIRRNVKGDLERDEDFGKDQVVAAAIRLIDHTGARVGNEAYTRMNGSHGITTLKTRHLNEGNRDDPEGEMQLRYRGKGGRDVSFDLKSPAVIRVIHRCSEISGETLFQYEGTDGNPYSIHSHDVNEYLQRTCPDATAKDFRTWKATLLCFSELALSEPPKSEAARSRVVNAALKKTAAHLYHKPSTCRKYYVHPRVIEAFMEGESLDGADRFSKTHSPRSRHSVAERSLIEFLTDS